MPGSCVWGPIIGSMKTTDGKLEDGGGLKTGGFFSNCGRGGGAIENKQMRGGEGRMRKCRGHQAGGGKV